MKHLILIAALSAGSPALAQSMVSMPGMDMGKHPVPGVTPPSAVPAHADHAPAVPATGEPQGTDQAPGSAEAPPIARDLPAARFYDGRAMSAAADAAMHPGTPSYSQARLDLAEYQFRKDRDGYYWEGEAWAGDLNRFVLRSRGEGSNGGSVGQRLDSAEVQALYSRALDPWWNLQVGVRQDIRPTRSAPPGRTYATIGVEGMAPYKFDVQAQAFLSDKGQLTGRFEASVDERLTRRLILQPRVDLDLSAQDMPAQRRGAGLTNAELGLRLGYEISRQFVPYVGLSCNWAVGKTADYARADGETLRQRSLVLGFRGWF